MRMRNASGVRERDLSERARRLRDSVDPLLPRLTADCETDRFDRLRQDLELIRESKDDPSRLARYSRWGDSIPRAYAGLLKFYLEPKMPGVLAFPIASGEVSFAPLSHASREAEVAVQQFEDPERLMIGYLDWTRKGYRFFAGPTRLWCTGRSTVPPPEVRQKKISELPYKFLEDPVAHRLECIHLKSGEPRPYIEVGWNGAGIRFRVCRKCVKSDRQLLSSLTEGIAVPDPAAEFPVSLALNVTCHGGEECVHARLPEPSRGVQRAYALGRLSDAEVVATYLEELQPRLEAVKRPTIVVGGVCYGSDRDRFLEALHPSAVEQRALRAAIGSHDGYLEIDEPSASRALERLWSTDAEAIVESIVADPAEARRYRDEARHAPGRIAELLKRAQRRTEERELLDALPRYSRLAREAAYVDAVARAYRVQGAAGAERTAVQSLPHEGKERGLAYGLLLALDRASSHTWQFSDTEREFGASLETLARALFRASPEEYHSSLESLFATAGVADWGARE